MAVPTETRIRRIACLLVLMIGGFVPTDVARGQEAAVDRIEYSALTPGQRATVVVHGKQLKDARRLWIDGIWLSPKEGQDPNSDNMQTFAGDIPADVAAGIHPARVITPHGTSESQPVVIDSLATSVLPAESENAATAPLIPLPSCLTGQLNPVKPRYVRVALTKGRVLSVDVIARRLNSDLDPAIRVTAPDGREVSFVDDVPGIEGDAVCQLTADVDGEYLVELRDSRYSGGARHFFHLRLGDFPTTPCVRPRVAVPGQTVRLPDHDGQTVVAEWTVPPAVEPSAAVILASAESDSTDRTLVSVMTVAGSCILEAEPNDARDTATSIAESTTLISGMLARDGDVDWYRLTASAPGPLCVTAHTRDVNSPADVVLQLFTTDGSRMAEADENGPLDAQLITSLPAAGDYFLQVNDLGHRGGTEWTYDLELDRSGGRIEVTVAADRVNVPRGGSVSLTATVKRINCAGPLLLTPKNLPASITSAPVWLDAKQSTVPMVLTAVEMPTEEISAEAGAFQLQALVPEQQPPANDVIRLVPPPPKKKDGEPFRSMRARADLFAAVRPAAQFALRPAEAMLTVRKGESVTVTIQATRHADWPMPIEIALAIPADQLPAGITMPGFNLENNEGTLTVTAAADAVPGRFTLFAQGTAKKDKETAVYPIPAIQVDIVE